MNFCKQTQERIDLVAEEYQDKLMDWPMGNIGFLHHLESTSPASCELAPGRRQWMLTLLQLLLKTVSTAADIERHAQGSP